MRSDGTEDDLSLIKLARMTSSNTSGGIKPDRKPTIGIRSHAARRLAITGQAGLGLTPPRVAQRLTVPRCRELPRIVASGQSANGD